MRERVEIDILKKIGFGMDSRKFKKKINKIEYVFAMKVNCLRTINTFSQLLTCKK